VGADVGIVRVSRKKSVSAASAGPDKAPGHTIHAASPVAGASVDGNSCLMQRQPVYVIGRGAIPRPPMLISLAPKAAFIKRTCQEYEWVAVKYQRGNGSMKYYVESVAVPPDRLFILKTRLTLSFYATQTADA
jgi:hypothetical protein